MVRSRYLPFGQRRLNGRASSLSTQRGSRAVGMALGAARFTMTERIISKSRLLSRPSRSITPQSDASLTAGSRLSRPGFQSIAKIDTIDASSGLIRAIGRPLPHLARSAGGGDRSAHSPASEGARTCHAHNRFVEDDLVSCRLNVV